MKGSKFYVVLLLLGVLPLMGAMCEKKDPNAELQRLRFQNTKLEETVRSLNAQLRNKDFEIDSQNKKIKELIEQLTITNLKDAEIMRLNDRITDLKKDVIGKEAEKMMIAQRNKDLEGTIDDLRKVIARMDGKIQGLEAVIIVKDREIARLIKGLPPEVQKKIEEIKKAEKPPKQKDVEIGTERTGLWVYRIKGTLLFDSGKAVLRGKAKDTLDDLAKMFKTDPKISKNYYFRVDGHADIDPIKKPSTKAKFDTNWELSAARAMAVLRYLEKKGVPSKKLYTCAYSMYVPIKKGDTKAAKRINRRVEIVLVPKGLKIKKVGGIKADDAPKKKAKFKRKKSD